MKSRNLVAVILQLVVTIIEINGYKFGDIIAFPRFCNSNGKSPLFVHYAIYVGPKSVRDVGQGDNDIVHHTYDGAKMKCAFGQLAKVKDNDYQETTYNYLDGIDDYKAGTEDEIAARIVDYVKNCPKYNVFRKNCEHMATTIRYGKKHSLQCGALTERWVTFRGKRKKLLKQVKELYGGVKCLLRS